MDLFKSPTTEHICVSESDDIIGKEALWIFKIIQSCQTKIQLDNANKLIGLFANKDYSFYRLIESSDLVNISKRRLSEIESAEKYITIEQNIIRAKKLIIGLNAFLPADYFDSPIPVHDYKLVVIGSTDEAKAKNLLVINRTRRNMKRLLRVMNNQFIAIRNDKTSKVSMETLIESINLQLKLVDILKIFKIKHKQE